MQYDRSCIDYNRIVHCTLGERKRSSEGRKSPTDEFLGITIVSGATSQQQEFSGSHGSSKLKQELQSKLKTGSFFLFDIYIDKMQSCF